MIKASDIIADVLQIGKESPETTRDCWYFNSDGSACCIVGVALAGRGLSANDLLRDEQLNWNTGVVELFTLYADKLGLVNDVSIGKLRALEQVQEAQDNDQLWGLAIEPLEAVS